MELGIVKKKLECGFVKKGCEQNRVTGDIAEAQATREVMVEIHRVV